MPTVSAIIPTYNRREFVANAVASVLSQSYPDFELIVIDDGSDDGTAEHLAERFSDPRLRVVVQENLGVSAARNAGAARSNGKWLAFLDSDDAWEPEKLSRQLAALAENPGVSACYTDETWFRRGKWANQCKHHAKYSGDIFAHCLALCIISPSSVMIERELYASLGGFDESLPACEDYDLWLRLSAAHKVLFLDERLIVKVNGHEGQLSAAIFALDRFRVRALWKLALDETVGAEKRAAALETLARKAAIVSAGAARRGEAERARVFAHSAGEAERLLAEMGRAHG